MVTSHKILNRKITIINFHNRIFDAIFRLQKEFSKKKRTKNCKLVRMYLTSKICRHEHLAPSACGGLKKLKWTFYLGLSVSTFHENKYYKKMFWVP